MRFVTAAIFDLLIFVRLVVTERLAYRTVEDDLTLLEHEASVAKLLQSLKTVACEDKDLA